MVTFRGTSGVCTTTHTVSNEKKKRKNSSAQPIQSTTKFYVSQVITRFLMGAEYSIASPKGKH